MLPAATARVDSSPVTEDADDDDEKEDDERNGRREEDSYDESDESSYEYDDQNVNRVKAHLVVPFLGLVIYLFTGRIAPITFDS